MVSVIYGDSHGQGVVILVRHRQFGSTRILQQPRFPIDLGKKKKKKKRVGECATSELCRGSSQPCSNVSEEEDSMPGLDVCVD